MPRPSKGPRLEKNEFGRWEVQWSENGRTKRVSTGETSESEAQKFFAGWLTDREGGGSSGIDVNEALDLYDRDHVEPHVIDKQRERDAMKPLRAFFGDMAVVEITKTETAEYERRRRTGKLRWSYDVTNESGETRTVTGGGRPVSDSTIRRELTTLISAIGYCVAAKKIKRDDAPVVDLPPQGDPKDIWLEDFERDTLFRAFFPGTEGAWQEAATAARRLPRGFRFALIAGETAARKRRVERLQYFNLDMDRWLMKPPQPKPEQVNPATARRKKKSKKRQVPVPISSLLKPYLQRMYTERLTTAKDGGIYVLDHPGAIRKTFNTAVEKAAKMLEAAGHKDSAEKMRQVTPHTLRHTWATRAAQNGVPMFEIAGVLGDDEATVRRNYAHHCPEYLRNAVDFRERNPGAKPGETPGLVANNDQQ